RVAGIAVEEDVVTAGAPHAHVDDPVARPGDGDPVLVDAGRILDREVAERERGAAEVEAVRDDRRLPRGALQRDRPGLGEVDAAAGVVDAAGEAADVARDERGDEGAEVATRGERPGAGARWRWRWRWRGRGGGGGRWRGWRWRRRRRWRSRRDQGDRLPNCAPGGATGTRDLVPRRSVARLDVPRALGGGSAVAAGRHVEVFDHPGRRCHWA